MPTLHEHELAMASDHDHNGEVARWGMCMTCMDRRRTARAAAPVIEQDQLQFPPADHDGGTYRPDADRLRLNAQGQRVLDLMSDGRWRTLAEIADATGDPQPSVSARLRDLRKPKFGGFTIERRQRDPDLPGLHEYRLAR